MSHSRSNGKKCLQFRQVKLVFVTARCRPCFASLTLSLRLQFALMCVFLLFLGCFLMVYYFPHSVGAITLNWITWRKLMDASQTLSEVETTNKMMLTLH